MEHALIAGTITEEGHRYSVVALELAAQGSTHRCRDRRAEDARLSQDTDAEVGQVHRATLAFTKTGALAKEFRHGLLHLTTLGNRMTVRAVVASHVVIISQGQARPHSYGFL